MQSGKHFTGTWHIDPIPDEESFRLKLASLPLQAWAAQVEKCPETGRLHIQFYFATQKRQRFTAIRGYLEGAHVEACRSPGKAWQYCTKEDTRAGWTATHGDPPAGQGARSDLRALAELARTAGTAAVAEADPMAYIRYERGLRAYELVARSRDFMQWRDIRVVVRWGPTGTGKTRAVAELGDVYPLDIDERGNLWFDGYVGQQRLLVDEFYGQVRPSIMLKLLDGYVRPWQVKGGFIVPRWTEVYITCNVHPQDWYGEKVPPEVKAALARRLTEVTYVGPS